MLEKQIREKEYNLDSRSRKRGAIMLTYCLLLLWYIGFERPYNPELSIARNIPLAILSVLTMIELLCCKWLSQLWRYTLIACFVLFVIFTLLVLYISDVVISSEGLWWLIYTKRVITIIILLPIFYQLYVNWLYSKAYILYLNTKIDDEHERYTKSKAGLEEKNEKLVDPSYDSAFRKILLNKMEGDNAMTELNNLLYQHLQVCCTPPGPIRIIINWWKYRDEDKSNLSSSNNSENEPQQDDIIEPDQKEPSISCDPIIIEKYNKYKGTKPAPKISVFCETEHIDELQFRSYHNLQKSKEFQNLGLRGSRKK